MGVIITNKQEFKEIASDVADDLISVLESQGVLPNTTIALQCTVILGIFAGLMANRLIEEADE